MLIGLSSAVGRILHLEFGLLGLHLRWKMKVKCFHFSLIPPRGAYLVGIFKSKHGLFSSKWAIHGYFG